MSNVRYFICAAVAMPALAFSADVTVQDLGTLGGRFTVATDLNASGQVTGYSETADGQIHAFLYVNGQMQDLGTLGGPGSLASALNDAGQITGFSLTATGDAHAFVYRSGAMIDLGPAGSTSSGKAINASGQVAGQATPAGGQSYALLYSGGKINSFGQMHPGSTAEGIGGQAQITGTYPDTNGSHAFIYDGKVFADLMPGYSSFVSGTRSINTAGSVTGGFQIRDTLHGFVYSNGRSSDLGSLGGDYTVPTAISNAGKITGVSARADGAHHAFIYSAGSPPADLGTLDGTFSVGYALNELDQVTGESETSSGQLHAFVTKQSSLLDVGAMVENFYPGSVTESFGTAINGAGQVIGRYTISTPADTTMPTLTRSFIATLPPSATNLFQDLISLSVGVGPGKSLVNKVQAALAAYLVHDTAASCSTLTGYRQEVDAQTGKKISAQQAALMLQKVDALWGAIGCTP
jgi:probable HAF family extracellular repeat protein